VTPSPNYIYCNPIFHANKCFKLQFHCNRKQLFVIRASHAGVVRVFRKSKIESTGTIPNFSELFWENSEWYADYIKK